MKRYQQVFSVLNNINYKLNNRYRQNSLAKLVLAIVVFGLALGGILFVLEMKQTVRHRDTIAQLNGYREAVITFKDRYGSMPGDIGYEGLRRIPECQTKACAPGGNQDGIAGEYYGLENLAAQETWFHARGYRYGDKIFRPISKRELEMNRELIAFWPHLSAAGLIPKLDAVGQWEARFISPGRNVPLAKLGGIWTAFYLGKPLGGIPQGYVVALRGVPAAFAEDKPIRALRAEDARIMDRKMDDGNPLTGSVVAGSGMTACIKKGAYLIAKSKFATCDLYIQFDVE